MTDLLVTATDAAGHTTTRTVSFTQAVPPPAVRRIRNSWYHSWKTPFPRNIPSDVLANLTMMSVGMAQSSTAGTGLVNWAPGNGQTAAEFKADVGMLKTLGVTVPIGIGGSGDGGIVMSLKHPETKRADLPKVALRTSLHAQQMFDSVSALVSAYGFNGVDFDLESGAWTESVVVEFVSLLKATWPTFVFGITPGLYGDYTARWLSLARALGANLSFFAPMLYDFPEAHSAATLLPVALDKIKTCIAGGVPVEKYVLGLMCNEYYNTTPTADAVAVAKGVLAAYPGLGGVFHWEHASDAAHGWPVARTVLSLFK